ncbi:hypothetical protein LPJ64_004601 [Coemansia asiatica]|uniref:Cytochrome P450 n=1 Tax=Coemansia asiatica TaxID=1052880 RepID=A0A9W8CIY9_9FUNG|nr:hypothetical protein LPJ64_004601 [Coemansia asiatica]
MLGPNNVAICDPSDCRTVLKSHRFIKGDIYDKLDILGGTMFTTRSPKVANTRRRQIGPAFTLSHLSAMEPVIIECGINAIRNKWDGLISQASGDRPSAEINFSQHFSLATFDIMGTLGYGQKFNALKNNQSQITNWLFNFNKLTMISITFKAIERFPLNLIARRLIKSKDEFFAYGDKVVQTRRNQINSGELSEKPTDILQALLDSEDPESKARMTPKEISAETIEIMVAGSETTSLTMTWALHYLLLYPEVYSKAVSEVRGKFPFNHTITYNEAKMHLQYIEAFIYETLRIHAVSGIPLPRVVPQGGVTLQGHFLPEGTTIAVNIAGANHHQETWKKPRKFMPERFLSDEKAKQTLLTFSSGVRVCPGRNLAFYEMMILLSNIIKDYDLALPADALFRPESKDKYGNPRAMPCIQNLTVCPKNPERDCRVVFPNSRIPGSSLSKITRTKLRIDSLFGRGGQVSIDDYYRYGDIYTTGPNSVVICNPSDCRSVLGTHRFAKTSSYKAFALVEENIFTTRSPELVHTRRKQVGPAFTHGHLNEMEPMIMEFGIHAIRQKWDQALSQSLDGKKATVNYAEHFFLSAFDIVGALGYGQKFNALINNKAQAVDWVNDYLLLSVIKMVFGDINRFPINFFVRRLIESKNDFAAFGNAATQKRRDMLASGELTEKPKDILQALLEGEDPDSKIKMTPLQITAENIIFLIAGTDTTSLTLSWTLHYLMLYPNTYKKAVSEVRSKFRRNHTISYAEAKANLPYIEACIYESMRIQPVSGIPLLRVVPKGGATFQGYFLPEGTKIGVNIAGVNHHQGTWNNPRKFFPERFIENEKAKQNVFTFSSGVRICPGRHLAQYEMLIMLSNILKDYDFELPDDALFRPDVLNSFGYPQTMPCTHYLSVGPMYPERDCRIVISKAEDY